MFCIIYIYIYISMGLGSYSDFVIFILVERGQLLKLWMLSNFISHALETASLGHDVTISKYAY